MARGNRGIGVVAEHAVVADLPPNRRIAHVETGIQRPAASLFRVPGQRKLDQSTPSPCGEDSDGHGSRTHHIVDLRLSRALFPAFGSDLPPPLIPAAVPGRRLIPGARCAMEIRLRIWDAGRVRDTEGRAMPVLNGACDVGVTVRANRGVNVLVLRHRLHCVTARA